MKHWIQALRLRTLPLAVSCIGMGAILAASNGMFNSKVVLLALLTTIALQILSNLANDYGDTIHGADNVDRVGPQRSVQQGLITPSQMRSAIIITAIISLVLGLALIYIADIPIRVMVAFLALGIAAIVAAVLYTNGKIPYGYMGLGDISVFLFFGIVGVMGTYYLQAKSFDWSLLLPSCSCGLLTVAVLNVNNIRDIESDKKAGKYSVPVRLGRRRANIYHTILLVLGILLSVIYILMDYGNPLQFTFLLVLPLLYINAKAIHGLPAESLDPYLKQMALTNVAFVILFGFSVIYF